MASLHNLLVVLRRKIREWILERVVAIALNGLQRHILAVVADADETNLALPLGHLHSVI